MGKDSQFGHAALRKGRSSIHNQIYLITTVTTNREPIFQDWRLGRLLVHTLRRYQNAAETLCYVVMPDHLHWLMRLQAPFSLSQVVRGIKGSSSNEIRRYAGRSGPIWQRGFHDHALRTEENLLSIARYVVANPLRAGLVEKIGDYPLWDAIWLE
ncbi:MAG TPA: transposase [Gammaproteobacteria bacterium]|nr:transposase [Gammaproteobacteria bacterium]